MNEAKHILIDECKRQEESCLYTSTTFYFWLKSIRLWNKFFVITPIVLGGVASWNALDGLKTNSYIVWGSAVCALLAGLFPVLLKALNLDVHVEEVSRQAGIFKNLQDRFRQLGNFATSEDYEKSSETFETLMKQLEQARATSITPPERFFRAAQIKVKSGDYTFDFDLKKKSE